MSKKSRSLLSVAAYVALIALIIAAAICMSVSIEMWLFEKKLEKIEESETGAKESKRLLVK